MRGGKPKCVGVRKNWKKRRWGVEIYPPAYAKRWGIKKIPSSPGPRGPWDKRKKSGIFRNFQEFSGIFRKNQEFSGNIRKNQEKLGKIRNFQEFQTPGGPGGEKKIFPKRPWA